VTGESLKAMKATPTTTIASDGLFSPIKIPDSPSRATLIGIARINDRESYQIVIEDSSIQSIQLFFDVESGLLLRRVNVTNTMLGPLNVQWDFSDYRDVSASSYSSSFVHPTSPLTTRWSADLVRSN